MKKPVQYLQKVGHCNLKLLKNTIGKEYIVLSIEFYDNLESSFSNSLGDFVAYRFKDNDGIVIPYPAKPFEIVLQKVPSVWIMHQGKGNTFSVIPKTWARSGDLVMESLTNGKIVGYQGRGTGRPIYEVTFDGKTYYTAITIGDNGFIVGANPTTWP